MIKLRQSDLNEGKGGRNLFLLLLWQCLFSKNHIWVLCGFLSISLMILSCSEVVDLNSDEGAKQIVIYGRITDGTAGNQVTISLTSSFNGEQEPISGAEVTLLENGIPLANYLEDEAGIYLLDLEGDSASTGQSYAVEITLLDGTQYRSAETQMPSLAAIDRPKFDASVIDVQVNQAGLTQERNLVQLFVDTEIISAEDYFLRWNVIETYSFQERIRVTPIPPDPCYVTNDITGNKITMFNGAALRVDNIRDQLLVSTEIDSRFAFDYYFSVVQFTMDKDAFDYWSKVNQIANLQGSIFDQVNGVVNGNLINPNDPEEEVLGYFEVVRSDTTRARVRADAIDFSVLVPCPHQLRGVEPPECTFCPLLDNSTIVRPYFFED